jgi:hypothetical protein
MLSRSVWHKFRESRPVSLEGLQDVLQGLQPAKPVAGRMFWANAGDSLTQAPGDQAQPTLPPRLDPNETDTIAGETD